MKRIILAGGSGFLGGVLAAHFQKLGCEIVVLTRSPKPARAGIREVGWDGRTLGDWARELDGAAAVINLTGRSVDCRYNAENRRLILESRVDSTRVIGEAIAQCAQPPAIWLNSSTATIYRHTFGRAWDESGEIAGTPAARDEFSVYVAVLWEQALWVARTPRTQKVALRTAMVLGTGGNSVFPVLRRLARLGLGGRMGNGQQYVSWIHETDFCRAIEWLIARNGLEGGAPDESRGNENAGPSSEVSIVNLAAPIAVTNADLMLAFRELCQKWVGLPMPRWVLEIGALFLGTETELVIKSRRVNPRRLTESGFEFKFLVLRAALADLQERMEAV